MHRLIMQSACYQQSIHSEISETANHVDTENRLLWKFNRRRLSAEEIRDSLIAVSGRLVKRLGGPSVMVPVDDDLTALLYDPEQWVPTESELEYDRRSVYLIKKRNLRMPFLEVFDQPDLQTSCAGRGTSTHAPQALELLNGKLANNLARSFAERLIDECNSDVPRIVDRAFLLMTGKRPTAAQRQMAIDFLRVQPVEQFALAMFNLNAFLYVD